MITIITMNNLLLTSLLVFLFVFASCQNNYQQNVSEPSYQSPVVGVSADAFQVTSDEYGKYFESRYGLLHQKFNDRPFTGRILTIDAGDTGDYISADETWKEGKKNGLSARWFSNGMKMYERNYSEGRWHGTVTRWWPNGQKMYVRAYTNGTRHGKEATWRSDGSPINTSNKSFLSPKNRAEQKVELDENDSSSHQLGEPESGVLPAVEIPSDNESEVIIPSKSVPVLPVESNANSEYLSNESLLPVPQNNPVLSDDLLNLPGSGSTEFPSLPQTSEMPLEVTPELPASDDGFPPLPGLPESEDANLPSFPSSPPSDEGLPPLPGLPDSSTTDLPAFPDSGGDDLPPLPGSGGDDLPPLPGSGSDDLPPLPSFPDDSSGGLPPLPGDDSLGGGLPPLPDFPE
jgi:hypothetical protein